MPSILHHLKSNAVAYLALFVALGGTGYAATRLPAGSVGSRALKNHSVSADKLDRSSIAGYVRDWAEIGQNGKIAASRPGARLIGWTEGGPAPGGIIQWSRPIPTDCFPNATTGVVPSPAYASVQITADGGRQKGEVTVQLSEADTSVSVAVICAQP
jgi:hypothetical protein